MQFKTQNDVSIKTGPARVAWVVGTRGDALALGPALERFRIAGGKADRPRHWLLNTGEQGMAMQQALDWLGIRADEDAPLCHPADEPVQRLQQMIGRIERFARHHKATHLVFTGCGATAAAAALTTHGRANRGLWLRPADPAGVLGRLRLEAGYARMIEACRPSVNVWPWPGHPSPAMTAEEAAGWDPAAEIPGLRPEGTTALVAVLRREWGMQEPTTTRLARAAADWARTWPELDWVVLSNLNARLEGPLRALAERPANLLLTPPLPYPLYRQLLAASRAVLTDNAGVAAEALAAGVGLGTLGDTPGEPTPGHECLIPDDLNNGAGVEKMERLAGGRGLIPPAKVPSEATGAAVAAVTAIQTWLGAA